MKLWKDFLDDLLPQVPGCDQAMATFHLRRAAQDFCEKTLFWREWLDDVTTDGVVDTYDLPIDSRTQVVQLLRATLDGQVEDVITPDDLAADWRTSNSRRGIFSLDTLTFTVTPLPAVSLIVQIEAALKPSNTATGVIDTIYGQYAGAIAAGAAGRLHAMPGKPYSVPNSSARTEFEAECARVASEVWHSFSRAPRRVAARFI